MKRFFYTAAVLVFVTTAAFADTLPRQVQAEAARLLKQVDAANAAASARPALKPAPLTDDLVGDLQRFGVSASRLSVEIDKSGGPVDLRCIFRGMAEETDNQLKAASSAATGADQSAALGRLWHMLEDAVEIAPAVGSGKTVKPVSAASVSATCPGIRKF